MLNASVGELGLLLRSNRLGFKEDWMGLSKGAGPLEEVLGKMAWAPEI